MTSSCPTRLLIRAKLIDGSDNLGMCVTCTDSKWTKKKKSNKSKQKKEKRLEEKEKNNANWKLVEHANNVTDPLESFVTFQKFTKNDLNLVLECSTSGRTEPSVMEWAFQLTKSNMKTEYEANWGWNDKEKQKELNDDRMWFLVAFDSSDRHPVGFVSFRFDLDFGDPVVYCYEIQLTPNIQRKGLGRFFIQILHLFAKKFSMLKVVATVLHSNETSKTFFMDKLKYNVDDTSLPDECYVIVSKHVR